MAIIVATALEGAEKPDPELAASVVRQALSKAGTGIARSVLLFLSSEFARHAQAAVAAASRAANCLQVLGCTAPGVFNEDDWIIDRPGATAMVMAGDAWMAPTEGHPDPTLCLAEPSAATMTWLSGPSPRFGMLSADGGPRHPGKVWGHAKVAEEGRYEARMHGVRGAIGLSRGIRILSPLLQVTQSSGYDITRLDGYPALNTLLRELPLELRGQPSLPMHMLFAGVVHGDPPQAIEEGRYNLVPLIGTATDERSVTLGAPIEAGARLFWSMRSALAAERDTRLMLDQLDAQLGDTPDFGVLFPCIGRGPYFFDGIDRDLDLLRLRHPRLPIIGAYSAGEIAPSSDGTRILHNCAVLGLFKGLS
jgi:small ligand-binding sensory domain FIST